MPSRTPSTRPVKAAAMLLVVFPLVLAAAGIARGQATTQTEPELVAILASGASEADKAIACKRLAVIGSAAAVPELAKLLSDEHLASWARIALEAIPDKASDAALRDAARNLSGRLAIGAINSLGVRRDVRSVELLASMLSDEDAEVAVAAAAALGKIGTQEAAAAVREAFTHGRPTVRPAAARACIECAERLLGSGDTAAAVALYDLVRWTSVVPQRVLEATRGAILARGDAGIPLLLEQLRATDRGRFRIGLSTARELDGDALDAAVVAELGRSDPARDALLVNLLADRGRPDAISAILKAAGADRPREVRLEALKALGRVGNATSLATLLEAAGDSDHAIAAAASAAIAELRADGIDAEILARLPGSKGRQKVMLLELVGSRRIDAVPQVIESLESDDAAIRSAAVAALGEVVDLERLPVLVGLVTKPRDAESAAAALAAVSTAAVRMPDPDACAAALSGAMQAAGADTKVSLLDVIGKVGGKKSLGIVAAAAAGDDAALQDAGTRLLGDWLTPDAGPVLLDLAKTLPDGKFRTRSFRGYLRVARQLGGSPDEKAAMCRKAMEVARDTADRRTVLDALASIPSKGSLELTAEAAADADLRDAARAAAAAVLAKSGDAIPGGWDLAKKLDLSKAKVEIVKATYGAGGNRRDVTELVRKRAGGLPLIVLPDPDMNKAFGGDPAPGTKKQLVIGYKLDGKPGEVTLEENAAVVLPTP